MQEQPLSQRLKVNNRFTAQPTRKNKIIEGRLLKPEMLSAGSDPLAKDQTFSLLTKNPGSMMATLYNKPPFARIRFPPILDAYSRTLANPICTQKYNLSESSRIGCNYSVSAQPLYIDLDSKYIKVAHGNEHKVQFTANADLLRPIASDQEELLNLSNKYPLDD